MTIDGAVVPGLLFLLAELAALAGVGYVIVRAALRETDDRVALAQGLVVGPAIWGVVVNLVMYALPGMAGAVVGWIFVLALAAVLVWRTPKPIRPRLRMAARFRHRRLWRSSGSRSPAARRCDNPGSVGLHLGMAASIREGGFPPEIPWNPWVRRPPYHYGSQPIAWATGAAVQAPIWRSSEEVLGVVYLDMPRPGRGHGDPAARLRIRSSDSRSTAPANASGMPGPLGSSKSRRPASWRLLYQRQESRPPGYAPR